MSRMSQLHAELSEQVSELGFENLDEAEQAGYGVDWDTHKLIEPQELAHKAWLEEKSRVLTNLAQLKIYLGNKVEHFEFCGKDDWEILEDAIDFIEKGEM